MRFNILLTRTLIFVTLVFTVTMYLYANKPTETRTIVQDIEGKFIAELKTLDNPLVVRNGVSKRVDECVRRTFNLSAINNDKHLSRVRNCYTKNGYAELVSNPGIIGVRESLERSYSVANLMPDKQMRVTGILTDVLDRETMQIKGSFNYQIDNGNKGARDRYLDYKVDITAVVVEVPLHKSPYGYAINRLSAKIKGA